MNPVEVLFWIALALCGATRAEMDQKALVQLTPQVYANNFTDDSQRSHAPILQPVRPKTPACFNYFPGTAGWNECFRRFTQDMAEFQMKMHDYVKGKTQEDAATNGGSGSYSEVSPDGSSYSYSNYNSQAQSSSNSFIGGYSIRAVNMGLSTSMVNGILKITLQTGGPIETFDRKVSGNVIQFSVMTRGQQKRAKVIIPKGVRMEDIRVDRAGDAIYITAPTVQGDIGTGNSNFQVSGISSNSGGFNQNFQVSGVSSPVSPVPVVPVPDYQNMFQNMFSNIFGQGGGNPVAPQRPRDYKTASPSSFYPMPSIWFY